MAYKAASGGIVSTVPLGYVVIGYQTTARAEIDPNFSPAVSRAFQLAADPANSLRDVLAVMRSSGMAGKRGRPLSLSTLQRMLTNPFYMGMVRSALMDRPAEGQHEALVSKELFMKVQRNLRRRRCS